METVPGLSASGEELGAGPSSLGVDIYWQEMPSSPSELSARRERAMSAWREWSSALLPAPLLQELAASESHLSLPRFVRGSAGVSRGS